MGARCNIVYFRQKIDGKRQRQADAWANGKMSGKPGEGIWQVL